MGYLYFIQEQFKVTTCTFTWLLLWRKTLFTLTILLQLEKYWLHVYVFILSYTHFILHSLNMSQKLKPAANEVCFHSSSSCFSSNFHQINSCFRMYLPSNMKKHMKIAKIIHYLFIIFVCFDEVISCLCTILTECTNKISDKNLNTIHVSVAMITF